MRKQWSRWAILFLIVCVLITACEKKKKSHPAVTVEPSVSVVYEKGRDFVGVVHKIDESKVTLYNTASEEEQSYIISGSTEIMTKHEKEISSQSLEVGQAVDVYLDESHTKVRKLQLSPNVIEKENVKDFIVNEDESYMEVEGVRYRYGSGFQAYSMGQVIDLKEITSMDEVSFIGVSGKAYSVIVTKGHGYLKPEKYKDFEGGTMTINGVAILPITPKMLVPVPEGTHTITMRNGDYEGSRDIQIEREKECKLDMSLFKIAMPDKGRVDFQITPVGAELYINGILTDYSKPVSMRYGRHSIRVVLEGYTTYSGVVEVHSASPIVKISLASEEAEVEDEESDSPTSVEQKSDVESDVSTYDNEHKITVSTPTGAAVYLDGTYMGVSPCTFSKKIGDITITLAKDGYTTKSYSVKTVDDAKDVQWSFPDLVNSAQG